MLLGRWNLDHDGQEGTLDLYRFSGLFSPTPLHGETDWRLGTYWGHDRVARRVNGRIDAHPIEFGIDWDEPNLDYSDRRGLHLVGNILTQDPVAVAGTMEDNRDGQTYAFLVGAPVAGRARSSSAEK